VTGEGANKLGVILERIRSEAHLSMGIWLLGFA
jgi:hypothetical protein